LNVGPQVQNRHDPEAEAMAQPADPESVLVAIRERKPSSSINNFGDETLTAVSGQLRTNSTKGERSVQFSRIQDFRQTGIGPNLS
jgi:hypothetical protein